MRAMALLTLAALILASCGVKRSLIRPEDVPAYEEERAREMEQRERERQEEQQRQQVLQPIRP